MAFLEEPLLGAALPGCMHVIIMIIIMTVQLYITDLFCGAV